MQRPELSWRQLLLFLALLPALPALAADEPRSDSSRPAEKRASPAAAQPGAAQGGVLVVIDPETKERRAPVGNEAVELLKGVPALNQSGEGLKQVRLPDGSYMIDLEGRFQEFVVAQPADDGRLAPACVSAPAPTTAPAKVREEVR